jgi:hypothetical protein
MLLPEFTVSASATFVMCKDGGGGGHFTLVVSEALPVPPFPDVKLAVLGYEPQPAVVVGLVT